MAQFTRWLMVGSVVASTLAGPAAEACWLTGCCGGAPQTTYYAPLPVGAPCNTCAPSPCNSCSTGTTFAQPTTALMPVTPVTSYRPLFGRTQPVTAYMPYTASYAAATPYTAGYSPYTSYRPVAVAPASYAVPATYSAPVTVQYAPQPVSQSTYYAPTAAPAPGCGCQTSTTNFSSGTLVSSVPVSNGTMSTSSTVTTSGANTTFGTTNQGSDSVLSDETNQAAPVNQENNVKPIEDPIKKSSTSSPLTPGRENDPRNKTALVPLVDNSQLAATTTNNAPLVRSLEELAPFNPVRLTSHVR